MAHWSDHPWAGVFPATLCPFHEDESIDDDLPRAHAAQRTVAPLARIVYNFGEPGCDAHQRMKVARWLMGRFPSPHFRRPVRPLDPKEIDRIRDELRAIDYEIVR